MSEHFRVGSVTKPFIDGISIKSLIEGTPHKYVSSRNVRDSQMREQFGVNYLQLRRKALRRFFGIDNIFLYQFGVYFIIWIWALTVLVDGRSTDYRTELAMSIAPIVVAIGYMMVGKVGTTLCAGGDLVMSFCTGQRAFWEYNEHNRFTFSTALIMSISLCMFVRMVRDMIIICTRDPDKPRIILEVTGDE